MKPTTTAAVKAVPYAYRSSTASPISSRPERELKRTRLPSVEASVFYSSRKIERGMVENPESVFGYQAVHFADFA